MKWIYDLKVGDSFLHQNCNWKGTVTQITELEFTWQWDNRKEKLRLGPYKQFFTQLEDAPWIPFTPLMEVLL